MEWSFDADNDAVAEANGTGSAVAEQLAHTYAQPGNYTAVFTVRDAVETTTATLDVQVV